MFLLLWYSTEAGLYQGAITCCDLQLMMHISQQPLQATLLRWLLPIVGTPGVCEPLLNVAPDYDGESTPTAA